MDNKTPQQRRAERMKYLRIQQAVRVSAILLAIILAIISLSQSCATRKAVKDLAAQLQAKKAAQAAAAAQAEAEAVPSPSAAPAGPQITLSFVGDCTLAVDENGGAFSQYYESSGAGYFFQNVKSIFEGDDLTVANLEGTFTLSENRSDKLWTYHADPSYTAILSGSGIDAVNVANDHTHDYGNEGYVDTLANLDNAGVSRFGYDNCLTQELHIPGAPRVTSSMEEAGGILVGLTGLWLDPGEEDIDDALENIQSLRDDGAQLVIVTLHWGTEYEYAPDDSQIRVAHRLIDAGVDLIIGHHSHVLQGIELYHGKYIAYSLGTFCFGGSDNPPDYDTLILQQTFTMVNGAPQGQAELKLIPCSISTSAGQNTCCPTPASGDEAQRILDKVYSLSDQLDGGIRPADSTT